MEMKGKAEFLSYHLTCFIELSSYLALHFGILYWHLDDLAVLRQVLSSDSISRANDNTLRAESGEQIYFELYCYLRLVRSDEIKAWLVAEFPVYEQRYELEGYRFGFASIDSNQKSVIESQVSKYADLQEMRQKYG